MAGGGGGGGTCDVKLKRKLSKKERKELKRRRKDGTTSGSPAGAPPPSIGEQLARRAAVKQGQPVTAPVEHARGAGGAGGDPPATHRGTKAEKGKKTGTKDKKGKKNKDKRNQGDGGAVSDDTTSSSGPQAGTPAPIGVQLARVASGQTAGAGAGRGGDIADAVLGRGPKLSGAAKRKAKRLKANQKKVDGATAVGMPGDGAYSKDSSEATKAARKASTQKKPAGKPRGLKGGKQRLLTGSTQGAEAAVAVAKKKKRKQGVTQGHEPVPVSAAAAAELASIADGSATGTLSDRLNTKHRHRSTALIAAWKTIPKRERKAIVDADRAIIDGAAAAVKAIVHPFKVEKDDHCESPLEAYRDVAPLLRMLAHNLGKTPETLSIYDPYYCAGAMVRHLDSLGFKTVHNKCEDFYSKIAAGTIPQHDVVVTNPPYSGKHVEKLLRFARKNGKPFLLLMPNYFVAKEYYTEELGDAPADVHGTMLYLHPWKRYNYWTPRGLRKKEEVQKQHVGAGGYRTSPFVSFWYGSLRVCLLQVFQACALLSRLGVRRACQTVMCAVRRAPQGRLHHLTSAAGWWQHATHNTQRRACAGT